MQHTDAVAKLEEQRRRNRLAQRRRRESKQTSSFKIIQHMVSISRGI